MRRNPEYQQAYSQLLQHPQAKLRAWTERGCIELKHLSVVNTEEDFSDFEGKFHLARLEYRTGFSLYDPSYDNHELRSLSVPNGFGVIKDIPKLTESLIQHTTTQVPVLIDLTIPIEPQLETIKAALQPFSQRVFGKLPRPAPQIDKFPIYLRILDAKACGISYSTIGDVLYLNMINYPGEFQRKKQAQAAARAAYNYRDSEYKLLLFSAPPETRYLPVDG